MITLAQQRILDVLTFGTPKTPAEIKRALPGRVPVSTIRRLLVELQAAGYVMTMTHDTHPNITAWVQR
jgi:DNA-binding IclR family transcriptional regulator